MNAVRPLEGRPAYAASKAAVSNFTQWLACHVARHYTPLIRGQRHRSRLLSQRANARKPVPR